MTMTVSLPTRISRGLQPFVSGDAFRALREEMDDLLSRFSADWDGEWVAQAVTPSLDLSETSDALQLRLDMPGVKPEDIDIEVTGNTIRISGERKEEREEKGKTFHRVERRMGKFVRSMTLPCAVRDDKITAESHDGILTVTLPKTETAKTHKVKVKSNAK
jgi:HSP20 family protein